MGAVWADDFGSRTFSNGAVDYATFEDAIASFSQRHPLLDVFAPGILITGANATGGTVSMGGTSQATPYISAIATLSQQIAQQYLGRSLTLTEFSTLLDTTSDLIIDGDDEQDNVTNTGSSYPRINAIALAEGILNLNSSPDGSTPGNTDNDGTNDPLYIPDNTISLVHTVNLAAGQVLRDIDFGNQLLPVNQSPILIDINKIADEDTPITFTQIDFTDAFDDADNDDLVKVQILNLPNNGTLQLNGETVSLNQEIALNDLNSINFIPDENFNGSVNFSWNGFDGELYALESANVTITVNPVDDLPVVENAIASFSVDEDSPNNVINLSNVFSDADRDAIEISVRNSNEGLVNATLDGNLLTLNYLENQSGEAIITLTGLANNETVESNFTVTVNPIDDLPVVNNEIASFSVDEDAPNNTFDISSVFSDADRDAIEISVSNSDEGLVNATLDGNLLTINYLENKSGEAIITLTGLANNETVESGFTISGSGEGIGTPDDPQGVGGTIIFTSFEASPVTRTGTWTAQPVPEPLTILGSLTALGFGTLFKHSLKGKK